MPTLQTSGTQVAVISNEHTLSTVVASGTFTLIVDTNAMVLGDIVEFRVKTKPLSGGVTRQEFIARYAHSQSNSIKQSIPVPSDQEYICTLTQTAGTGRSFPWKIMAL